MYTGRRPSVGRPDFNQYAGGVTLPDTSLPAGVNNRIVVNNAAGTIIPGTGNDDAAGTLDAQTLFRPTTTGTYYVIGRALNTVATGLTVEFIPSFPVQRVVA